MYAHSHGLNLNALIENFLVNLLGEVRAEKKNDVPDVVLNLLGAGEPVAEDDLNGREAYYQYLQEKYK